MAKHLLPRALAALALTASASAAKPAHPDLTGMWVLSTGETPVAPHGADLPLTPLGKARMDARTAEIGKGLVRSEGHVRCQPAGMPQMMTAPFGIQIMQNADRIVLNAEVSNLPRTIYFRVRHHEDADPTWNGDSVAHWEGRTLVVDTTGFNDEDAFDFNFDPPVKRTSALRVVERLHLENGGQMLVDDMTLIDPMTFTQPVKVSYAYRRLPKDAGLMEYVCEVDVPAMRAFDAQKTDRTPRYSHPF